MKQSVCTKIMFINRTRYDRAQCFDGERHASDRRRGRVVEIRAGVRRGGAALFLDRDGVVVTDTDYLSRVEDIAIIPGAAAVIAAANQRGVAAVLVTTRPASAAAITAGTSSSRCRMPSPCASRRRARGSTRFMPARTTPTAQAISATSIIPPQAQPRHDFARGLRFGARSHRSWLVGDKASDIDAAKRAGLAGALLVMTGYGERERAPAAALAAADFDVRFGASITAALALPVLAAP